MLVSLPAFFWDSYLAAGALILSGLLLVAVGFELIRLREACTRLRNLDILLASTDSIVITTDEAGLVIGFNAAAERMLGYPADQVVGLMDARAFHQVDPESEPSGQCLYSNFEGEGSHKEWNYLRRDGSSFPAIVKIGPIRNEIGRIVGYFGLGSDISARKSGEEALREKQELIESIAATSPTLFYIFDLRERKILYENRSLPATLGYSQEQIRQMGADPLPSVIHPEDLDILFNRYQSCAGLQDGEVLEIEFRCLSAAGELRWQYARDVVFKRDREGVPTQILVNVVDVTERKLLDEQIENQVMEIQDSNLALEIQTNALEEANAQLEALAFADGLTGIANHRSFQEELAKCFEVARKRKRRLALMLLDVDRFKQYNDTYGHPSGDIVLKRVAATLRDTCPEGCMAARYGGEEFAVICPSLNSNEVLDLAEEIRSSIENTPWPDRPVTVSIGAVSLSPDMTFPSEMVTAADNALYSSKASGRNCVTFYDCERQNKRAG